MDALDFENIVDRYYARLYRFALGLARNEPDACDLTQQTFAAWATKGHLLRDKTKVKTWLFTTLYRQFLLNCRYERQWPKEEISQSEHELPTPMPETSDCLEPELLMECLQSMNENFRAPLVLFYLQNHSYKEIADILAVHRNSDVPAIAGEAAPAERHSLPARAVAAPTSRGRGRPVKMT